MRLWGVSCSATKGLTITPALVLDTMQTQVLSLSSFLKIDPSPPPSQRKHLKRQNSLGEMVREYGLCLELWLHLCPIAVMFHRYCCLGKPHFFPLSLHINIILIITPKSFCLSTSISTSVLQVSRTGGGASIMLAAGTHVGAIYVWTLSAADLFGSVHGSGDNSLIDDGTKLHSLLQVRGLYLCTVVISVSVEWCIGNPLSFSITSYSSTVIAHYHNAHIHPSTSIYSLLQASDRPIIHLGLSLALDPAVKVQGPHGHSVSLALVASDTVATVRTHREAAAPDQKLSKAFGDHGSKRPITLCGEASFEHAVVSCSMQVSISISLEFKWTLLFTVDLLFHVECCIRQLCCSSIIIFHTTSIAHDHYTDIYPLST